MNKNKSEPVFDTPPGGVSWLKRTFRLSFQDAEDVAKQATLNLQELLKKGTQPKNVTALWFSIARRRALDTIKKRRREVDGEQSNCFVEDKRITANPERLTELRSVIRDIRNQLTPVEQDVFDCWFQGMELSETEEILSLRPGMANQHRMGIKKKARRLYPNFFLE
jgi:RNA polymerase sigma factor (sigma-70 family)